MDILFKNDDYAIIGGYIATMKTSMETLKREFEEELHAKIEVDNERIDLDFCWVPLEELKKEVKVYPLELIPYILEPRKEIVHFVSKQIWMMRL